MANLDLPGNRAGLDEHVPFLPLVTLRKNVGVRAECKSKAGKDLTVVLSALQDKVYENAEAQAKLFMEYVHSSKDEADDFDFEGDRQYDGGSYDTAFAGNTKHDQA